MQQVGIASEYDGGEALSQLVSALVAGVAMLVILVVGIAVETFFDAFDHRS